jgi:ADP-ribosylglycohydrolase/protein-tyrosine phosphatase
MLRTSETDPLRIAELPLGSGLLGLTLCPGKRGESMSGSRWQRDLDADLAVVRRWGANAVVTLIEADESAMLGVEALPQALHDAGIVWHHLPIRDVDAPDQRFETRWVYAGTQLRERLRAGQRVLIHCRGGLGRAGLVAAGLLVEFGASGAQAIRSVRAARPGAIETPRQEQWVLARRAVDPARDVRFARELGCLLGGALGDALGYRVEFTRWSDIRRTYGPKGIQLAAATGPLVVSDDTQMSLFTLEGQLRALREDRPMTSAVREAYLAWHQTQLQRQPPANATGLLRHAVLWKTQAPGMTCLSALRAGGNGSVEQSINDSKGCGGVMRTASLGFLAEQWGDDVVYRFGVEAAALTHGHPDGWAPAGVMALAVRLLMAGGEWQEIAASGLARVCATHPQATGTAALLDQVSAALMPSAANRTSASFGEGWVGDEALAVGLHAAATARGFSEAIENGANHDGDSDSTASIAGQLYGAKHGLSALPAEAVYRIDVLEPLLELAGEWGRLHSGPISSGD